MSFRTSNNSVAATIGKYTGIGKLGPRIDISKLMKIGKEEDKNMNNNFSTGPVEFQTAEETEKTAAFGPIFMDGVAKTLGIGLTGAAIAGVGNMISNAFEKRKYENNLKLAVQMTPTLQRYPMPMLMSYLPMIIKASPTVASDPRLLANYLESMLDAEGHLNLATFRELSALEGNVLQNNLLNNPIRTEFIKGMAKGIGGSAGNVLSKYNE